MPQQHQRPHHQDFPPENAVLSLSPLHHGGTACPHLPHSPGAPPRLHLQVTNHLPYAPLLAPQASLG
jgi:hypothetical protein